MKQDLDILILTAGFGIGHNNVAKAIKENILLSNPSVNILIKDLFEVINPSTSKLIYGTYKHLIIKCTNAYNYYYYWKEKHPHTLPDELFYMTSLKKITDYLFQIKPKIIISTFPICAGIVSKCKKKYKLEMSLITCITDVVDSVEWLHENTDLYFVPTQDVKIRLMNRGILEEQIKVTGIPVRKEFLVLRNNEIEQRKEKFNVLIMGGGFGSLDLDFKFLVWLEKHERIKTQIVTGYNKKLYKKLTTENSFKNIEVYGYVENVADLMDNADILISKSGGITIFEALHKRVPIIVCNSKLGQEIENSKFIYESGIGVIEKNYNDIILFLENVLYGKKELSEIKENINKIVTRLEAHKVGFYILSLL